MSAKILITGLSNTGKTTLLRTLKNVLVISRDGKPFSLELPHVNVPDYENIDELLTLVAEKMNSYKVKFKEYPDTIVFDSVSTIFTDIETNCEIKFKGFDIWKNVNKEIMEFLSAINQIQENNINIILITHVKKDESSGGYVETSKGSFGQKGGFLSTVDYAINIDMKGNKRIVTHRGTNVSRTLIEDMPDKQDANDFNLQEYVEKIKARSDVVTEKWSI